MSALGLLALEGKLEAKRLAGNELDAKRFAGNKELEGKLTDRLKEAVKASELKLTAVIHDVKGVGRFHSMFGSIPKYDKGWLEAKNWRQSVWLETRNWTQS
ncbi:unnamed protein product [Calypogeia fissa]